MGWLAERLGGSPSELARVLEDGKETVDAFPMSPDLRCLGKGCGISHANKTALQLDETLAEPEGHMRSFPAGQDHCGHLAESLVLDETKGLREGTRLSQAIQPGGSRAGSLRPGPQRAEKSQQLV